jgi:NTP pyrophosphatase (non-canonical NTP hydrolase)
MNLNEYQEKAKSTAIYPENAKITYTALGLAGEAGEVANKVKKLIRDGYDREQFEAKKLELAAEIGDVLWYVANLTSDLDMSLSAIAAQNLDKLADRKKRNVIGGDGDTR